MPLDLTAMFTMHDALRRELEHLARVDDDPRLVFRTAGWRRFKQAVWGHHCAEDEVLWPALRLRLTDQPGNLVVLEAMEAEHAAIGQLIATIDEAASGPQGCLVHLGDLIDSLVTGLKGHLAHEEEAVIPLLQQALTAGQWAAFEKVHSELTADTLSAPDGWSPAAMTGPRQRRDWTGSECLSNEENPEEGKQR
ncbi:hypothetical protein Rhe02_47400 [Rhizocola hellebori]|uniref:Hemerythrin-like domain-containing protein n=1 Tax=Rhizocola hellebori TaxID=1392758 RepID=A0A8J3VI79_9ACTN|nr:hemerythrin domain-containing protein [Rhizocola hellebori]GIH06673.1 hypothetical protein Rhe02_47400 [Rhizocola hellebori]